VKDILLEKTKNQTRLALVEDGALREIYVERQSQEELVGNIYVGRVMNVLPGMQAAFVDIGLEKNGFLYAGEAQGSAGDAAASAASRKKKLKAGQGILVQVLKEPGGTKGPRLTDNITLPGRMVVLMPMADGVGVSRRIEDDAARAQLFERATKLKPPDMGLIVRTAALEHDEAALEADVRYLQNVWADISVRANSHKPPALLHRELSLVHRAVRDMLVEDVESLKIDERTLYESAMRGAEMLGKSLCDKIELYQREGRLFDRYRVDAQLDKMLKRQVWLKSGGYIVIDDAEAMTVIDVNTGKFVGKSSLEETIFALNCEAAAEIAAQLRLRDIGGIVIVDFIDMDSDAHRSALLELFRDALKADRTKTNLVGMTGLGLVELTRKKVHQPICKTLQTVCPVCQGAGAIPSDETIARSALGALREHAALKGDGAFLIETTQGVAGQLALLGCPAEIRAFVLAVPGHRLAEYEVSSLGEHELPPKSRRIPKE
jgi:ribonuclease G